MATEPEPLTLSEAVHHAVRVCDPAGENELVTDLLARFEDRDEPIAALTPVIEQELAEETGKLDPEGEDPALVMAGAVATYLAFRRGQAGQDAERLLRLAADAEFDGRPPEHVRAWLDGARAS